MRTLRFLVTVVLMVAVAASSTMIAPRDVLGAGRSTLDAVSTSRQRTIDSDELANFVDKLFTEHLDEYGIPGAAFVMVKGDDIVLARGYGYADLDRQTPADPERTLFDIGSVTKLFTATAAMQLVEQGLIDLDADVNDYLTEVQVPATYAEPVTLRHLLTHTAGFDDRLFIGMVAPSPEERQPLRENLDQHLPPRVRPPGEVIDYSNYGITLAGHIVETVSGQSFDEYVTKHILEPLGMSRSGFDVPPDLMQDVAMSYGGFGARSEELEPWYLNHLPAGGLRTTALDVSAFMSAHLSDGTFNGSRILGADTVNTMHRTQFRSHPAVSGVGYGFFEHEVNGRRAVQHGGDWVGTAAILYLLPDENVGIFAAYNSGAGALARTKLVEALLERYFPAPIFANAPAGDAAERVSMFEGHYRLLRQDRHSFLQLPAMLLNVSMEVQGEPDGTLTTVMSRSPLFPEPLLPNAHWVETEPGVFRELNGTNTMAFDIDANGDPGRLHVYWPQSFSMDRVPWYQSTNFHVGILLAFVTVMLVATIGWPAGNIYRRLRHRQSLQSTEWRAARILGGLASAMILTFLLGFLLFFAVDTVGLLQAPATLTVLLMLPVLAVALTVLLVVVVVRLWILDVGATAGRVYHTVIAVTLAGFFPILNYWGLLGFNY